MQYLVDGHNLIPKVGLRLDSMDDEQQLIDQLKEFCRIRRATIEVFFDGAPPGSAGTRSFGAVSARFIPKASSADAAIENRLVQLGRSCRNWIVVSSDQRVQNASRAAHAAVLSSEEFARLISEAQAQSELKTKTEASMTPDEVDDWLRTFNERH